MKNKIRYQDSPWYVRVWRHRHLVVVPFHAVYTWWRDGNRPREPFWFYHWGMAMGLAHLRMEWVYDLSEVGRRESKEKTM